MPAPHSLPPPNRSNVQVHKRGAKAHPKLMKMTRTRAQAHSAAFPGSLGKTLDSLPHEPSGVEIACLRVFSTGVKKAVIERDTDLLTSAEMVKHRPEVTTADLEELKTWLKYTCFDRCPRKESRNIIRR